MDALQDRKLVLITGGNGFIGSHVASRLYRSGNFRIRVVDAFRSPSSFFTEPIYHELSVGNLCDPMFCRAAVDGVSIVFHFAANMGGMGTIHELNEFAIYSQNHLMTINLLQASIDAKVEHFLYASSACVYPEHLQTSLDPSHPVSLREDDAYASASATSPPSPQGLYGLEKLNTEQLLSLMKDKPMRISIARFHNVYGPGGAWFGGREKAPAALLRKALVYQRAATSYPQTFEIWGDGTQRRSFLFIDDAVDALMRLFHLTNPYPHPLNIGSEEAVSILQLAHVALKVIGIDPSPVQFQYTADRPLGVQSRSSNNERVKEVLGWSPSTSLADGMSKTGQWIASVMEAELPSNKLSSDGILHSLSSSRMLDLESEAITFGILLPITSRGGSTPDSCLENLSTFASSLVSTTWRDTASIGAPYRTHIYLAIDHDDDFLLSDSSRNKAEDVLRQQGFANVTTLICKVPRGHVCALWRECAKGAFDDGCQYMGLFGDDVTILDEGWMRKVDSEFHRISNDHRVPFGIGCVAFTDVSFPGMPTFPIIHRRHLDIFNGDVVPDIFINQDGDPYLFQLYRRWNASTMIPHRLSNGIGGSVAARYEKQHASDWTFETLTTGVCRVDTHIRGLAPSKEPNLTLDIVIPCYRVDMEILDRILTLRHRSSLSVMFIVIIDDPTSPRTVVLEQKFGARPDVRIRVNKTNQGASASRNRGLSESSAEWVHFLDDDVVPNPDLLFEAENVIRQHPNAAGFVCNTIFPRCQSLFQTAIHLAGVTYFWDIASKIEDDVPWGVTANLIVRRNIQDGIVYDLRYPKTGGGEDIDFCRLKRKASLERGGVGFVAAPKVEVTHPWWNKGNRSYWRFYMWAYGDGLLVSRFPDLTYQDFAPNTAECLLLSLAIPLLLLPFTSATRLTIYGLVRATFFFVSDLILANVLHDLYNLLWRHPERNANINSAIRSGPAFWTAIVESTFIRIASEMGRVKGVIDRRDWSCFGRRFDWFAHRVGNGPRSEERRNSVERVVLTGVLFGLTVRFAGSA
ncbi:NAD-dependent epimerase/dehydratase [Coprinopsis sp. MPI-PUGE-AT-0042]|nr:NAD-dependent epimerase/dehydratase [Coprinopsis sp. MPI-PUGE-AT-0042]